MKVDVILRTHDFLDIHTHPLPRYVKAEKSEIVLRCISSLAHSISKSTHEINVIWIDDHSRHETIQKIHSIFNHFVINYKFIELEKRGWNESALKQFEMGKESSSDLIYFVEDDYLHYEDAIQEMIDEYGNISSLVQNEVAIYPFDEPRNYTGSFIENSLVVYGKNRHWRTVTFSPFTLMCNPKIVRENWPDFYTLATEYMTEWGIKNNITEDTTISNIWRNRVMLFNPIPSLALHLQFEEQKDPYINWKDLWDSISRNFN
jgi:hypothetical protein